MLQGCNSCIGEAQVARQADLRCLHVDDVPGNVDNGSTCAACGQADTGGPIGAVQQGVAGVHIQHRLLAISELHGLARTKVG